MPHQIHPSNPCLCHRLRVVPLWLACVLVKCCTFGDGIAGHNADLLLAGVPGGRDDQWQVLREQPCTPGGGLPRHGLGGGEWLKTCRGVGDTAVCGGQERESVKTDYYIHTCNPLMSIGSFARDMDA